MYNPSKTSKYHVKTFRLCDSATGYVFNLLIYFGKETSYDPSLDVNSESAIKVFTTLMMMKPLSKGHTVFADRYYTTYNLLQQLLKEHHYYIGTVQVNRKFFPPQIKGLKLNPQESKFYLNGEESVMLLAWRDKKAKKNSGCDNKGKFKPSATDKLAEQRGHQTYHH